MADSQGASAWFSDAVNYPGIDIRRDFSALVANGTSRTFGSRSGRRRGAGGVPTISGTTVSIPPGSAIVDAQNTANDAPFLVSWISAPNVAGTPAHSSLPRVDIVFVKVVEVLGSPTTQAIQFGYQAGTAASSPNPPTALSDSTPVSKVGILGYVNVPASGSGSATVTAGPEVVAAGGTFQAARGNVDYPTTPVIGDKVFDAVLGYDLTWRTSGTGNYWSPDVPTDKSFIKSTGGGGSLSDQYDQAPADGSMNQLWPGVWTAASGCLPGRYEITAIVVLSAASSNNLDAHYRIVINGTNQFPDDIPAGDVLGRQGPVPLKCFYNHDGGDLSVSVQGRFDGGGNVNVWRGTRIDMVRLRG